MDHNLTAEQRQIRESVLKLCSRFDDAYWLAHDDSGEFPEDFCRAIAEAGWIGVGVPEQYGGAGLGVTEAALVLQAITESGAANSGLSAIGVDFFGSPLTNGPSTARSMIRSAGAANAAFSCSIPSHSRSSTPIIAIWNPASPSTATDDSVRSVATASQGSSICSAARAISVNLWKRVRTISVSRAPLVGK